MSVVITNVVLSKEVVKTGEQFKVEIAVKETVTEPNGYRLPFKLGENAGGIK